MRWAGNECEMADETYVVLLFSAATTVEDVQRAEMGILFAPMTTPLPPVKHPIVKPTADIPMYEAVFKKRKTIPLEQASGQVCASLTAPCPPGVPLVMPGEIFDHNVMAMLKSYGVKTVQIIAE